MKEVESLAKQNFNINYEYIGKIVDNKDPLKRGRLKCRILELISDSTKESNLPWCEVKGSLFSGDSDVVGVSSVPKIGSLVYISFLYNDPSFPIVTGYVRGKEDSSNLHKVENLDNTIFKTRNDNLIGNEQPPLNNNSIYPNNNVIETDTAVIEIDDTSSNKRISIQHKNGSYFEIRPDGSIQIKSNLNKYDITNGDVKEDINGSVVKIVGGTVEITTTTYTFNANLIVNGNLQVNGNLTTTGTITADDQITSQVDVVADGVSLKSHVHVLSPGVYTGPPFQ